MEIYKLVSQHLKEGATQKKIALDAKLNISIVQRFFSGKNINVKSLEKILEAMGLTISLMDK